MPRETDDFLAHSADVLTDWQGSVDSMRWSDDLPDENPVPTIDPDRPLLPVPPPPLAHFLLDCNGLVRLGVDVARNGDHAIVMTGPHLHFQIRDEAMRLSPVQMAALARFGRTMIESFRALVPATKKAGEVMARVMHSLRESGMAPDHPPTDPRERALWAVRNRNTGPARDPFTHRGIK